MKWQLFYSSADRLQLFGKVRGPGVLEGGKRCCGQDIVDVSVGFWGTRGALGS